ncbi:MAG: T9SS type A sorting domain-containing protein [Bacteroidetes bacterium]|nr:T9SS type A sorting domain-containing protein [Bacteroidota bacterium]
MKHLSFILLFLCAFTTVRSQYVQKVTSINYYGVNGLNPSEITVFKDKLYFFGTDDPVYVDKLVYTADGSAQGITFVKMIDSAMTYTTLVHLTVLDNLLIFNNNKQLWKSDGTTAGTSAIATLGISYGGFTVLGGKAYFAADPASSYPLNDQLWQTDGTSSGTSLLKTINPTGPAYISRPFPFGGKLFFSATDGVNHIQLWVSDGTAAGTVMLKKINPTGDAYPSNFTEFNGKLYFAADDGVDGTQLWVTDGTTPGTLQVTTIGSASIGLSPSVMTVYNSKLYFMGLDNGSKYQLWSNDGTTTGTVLVKADYTQRNGVSGFCPTDMAVYNNLLYMSGYDSINNANQLWVSDGSTAGTTKITTSAKGFGPGKMFPFKSRLIMTGYDTISGQEQLFASDGTLAGMVCPTPPDTWGQYPFYPWQAWVPFHDALYYRGAYSYFSDYQLCRYSETPFGIEKPTPDDISVYPNPTSGPLDIVIPGIKGDVFLEIYDCAGMLVRKQNSNGPVISMDLSNCTAGLYILRIIRNHQIIASRKVILR